MRLLLILITLLMTASAPAQDATEETPQPHESEASFQTMLFESSANIQLEVSIDGVRIGITPCRAELKPGRYFLTASAEGVEPLMQYVDITSQPGQKALLPTRPLSIKQLEPLRETVLDVVAKTKLNPHMIRIAMLLSVNDEEKGYLIKQADRVTPDDPVVDAIRSRQLLADKQYQEALEAADRSVEKLKMFSQGWRAKALAHLALGEKQEALRAAHNAVINEPYGWLNLRVRADIYKAMDNKRAADNDLKREQEILEELKNPPKGQS